MHTRTCNIDSIRFAVLVRDHNNGMPARSTAAAAQHSISTPALVSMAGQWGAVLAAAADAPAAVLAAMEANGSATALHSSVLRVDGVGYRCCCLQVQKTLDWINDLLLFSLPCFPRAWPVTNSTYKWAPQLRHLGKAGPAVCQGITLLLFSCCC